MYDKLWLIPFFPLIGSIINGLLGKRFIKSEKAIGAIGTGAVFLSFLVTCRYFFQLLGDTEKVHQQVVASWMSVGKLQVDWGFLFDPLSALMLMVVCGVGSLIHLYSIGYMHGEEGFYRYFSYLNLFIFSMIMLVLGNNALVMFIGWEGVGLCSYLLIGYYFEKQSAGDAAKKAFVMNRVGDFGFLLGLFTIFWTLGSHGIWTVNFVDFSEHGHLLGVGSTVVTVATLCFFLGATGKSAQLPLYTWLPDAMEGPTPVSALIHAATMVTAGVYMIGRMNVLFAMSPTTMGVVAAVGAATAIFAASIGFAQNDIKRVLAYSTVSQLGFMFVAMGVGAFTAGIFHLMTHAFFKACLFLGSGSVIHAMHHALHHAHLDDDPQDMRNMGGLRKHMPVTWATFGISCLAIAGLPFFAGFFSKDEILWWAFASTRGSLVVWGIAAFAAGMTAFYMFRCLYMTFYGKQKTDPKAKDHVHESPWVITLPLVVLAGLATVGGFVGVPHAIDVVHIGNKLDAFLAPVFHHTQELYQIEAHGAASTEIMLMVFSVVVALIGIGIATTMYLKNPELPAKFTSTFSRLHRVVFNKWYVDEIYDAMFVNTTKQFGNFCWKFFDVKIVDGIVNGVGKVVNVLSAGLRHTQTGLFQNYALAMVLGTVVMVAIYILN
ncbi:MAG: NADH-quinone oxidoreductase subunit L [Deltaproteobacteria bacterium]|jgi:NADH-quinone oxidoreductase subunit L|nr:NADH-quinone oxidoreductase subunit L [Deltaproteobacteria bacterium]